MLDENEVIHTDESRYTIAPLDQNETNFFNRELSWLAFNARVLVHAADESLPLLERVKFLAIYASNLDEFFQVRVAGLRDLVAAEVRVRAPDGRTPEEQLNAIRDAVQRLEEVRQAIFTEQLIPELRNNGVSILGYGELSSVDAKVADMYFDEQVFPILTPLAVDPGHPFPYILSLIHI